MTRPDLEMQLVIERDTLPVDPWQAVQATLALLRFAFGSHATALFTCDPSTTTAPRLVTSQGLTQIGLDAVCGAWRRSRKTLGEGEPAGNNDPPFLVMPCTDTTGLAGLVYLEGPTGFSPARLSSLVPLALFLARILRRLTNPDEPDELFEPEPPHPPRVDFAQLQVLLERNEWNVSRVARIVGVTRMTVYNRLRRAGVPRQRILKATPRPRSRPAPKAITTGAKGT